jgi:hypothetical protein
MPKDGTTLRAQLADRTLNPSRNVAQGNTAATMIDVRLELMTGVTFNPEDVYDALVDEVRRRQGLHQPRHELAGPVLLQDRPVEAATPPADAQRYAPPTSDTTPTPPAAESPPASAAER